MNGEAMYELAVLKDPPPRVVIGTEAFEAIMRKIGSYGENYRKYEKIFDTTDDGYKAP